MAHPLIASEKFDRVVTILRPTFTTNAHNEQVEGPPTEIVRFASVKPSPGTERFRSAETAADAPMRFIFRWEDDLVRVTDSILHEDGRTYEIASVNEIGRREGIEVLGTARGETPSEE